MRYLMICFVASAINVFVVLEILSIKLLYIMAAALFVPPQQLIENVPCHKMIS